MSTVVIAVVLTALVFDFTNGFHDTANAMATSIATGALRPRVAVVLAGVLNLVGAFLSVQVALTISSGLVDEARITPAVIFGGLVGAILWNLVTWLLGLPSSSSHALFGGLIGATWVFAGTGAINFSTVAGKVLLPLALSPVVAGVVALSATWIAYRIAARGDGHTITRGFQRAQIVSASMIALAHGTNDAQKTMGVITLTLITVGLLPAHSAPPLWVVVAAGLAIAAGTAMGGWRIIHTLGRRISDIQSPQGFAAETASAAVILSAAHLGFALSTTQVASGAVLGSAAGRRAGPVRWRVAGRMAAIWLLTLPAAATMGALAAWVAARGTAGTVLVGAVLVGASAGIHALSRRTPVTAATVTATTVTAADVTEMPVASLPPAAGGATSRARPRGSVREDRHDRPLGFAARRVPRVAGVGRRGRRAGRDGAVGALGPRRRRRRGGATTLPRGGVGRRRGRPDRCGADRAIRVLGHHRAMRPIRAGAVATSVAAALVLLPGTAAADVTVAASRAEAGARDVTITFRVTNNDPAVPTRTGRPAETESARSHRIRSNSSPARSYEGARQVSSSSRRKRSRTRLTTSAAERPAAAEGSTCSRREVERPRRREWRCRRSVRRSRSAHVATAARPVDQHRRHLAR